MRLKDLLNDVKTFQNAFYQPINQKPTLVSKELSELRYELMKEENEEYLEAILSNDLVEVADALGDQLYILCGTILTHGMQDIIEQVFMEIQRSNMSKLDDNGNPIINGENGVFDGSRPLGKILKPKHYFKPNLKQFL